MFCFDCEVANTINIPKTHLILGLSLPLAVLIGYVLAEPMELGSVAVVLGVFAVLCIPLLMRWYHPLLIFSWNSAISPVVFPGRAGLWMVMAFLGLTIAMLNRAVNPKAQFINVPPITHSLLLLAAVTVGTAFLTGGFGVASLGSGRYGGGKYAGLLMGIAGYFAMTSRRIPPRGARLYIAFFFLSGLSFAIANLAILAGPQFSFLLSIFSTSYAQDQMLAQDSINSSMVRIGGLGVISTAVYSYMLARFGIRGLLDFSQPWRLPVFLLAFGAGLFGGFRTYVMLFMLTLVALFYLEGLYRTRYLPMVLGAMVLGGAIILPQADKLPLVAQRAISFLPGQFDSIALESARTTVSWRVDMWKQVLPEVPKHFFLGKGFGLDPGELYMAALSERHFQSEALAGTILAGDYHNGPLSVLIPFGVYGMIAFLWFLVAGIRTLNRNYRLGDPAYRNVNALLLASFVARAFYFFVGFGSLHSDIPFFAGLLGIGVALNGSIAAIPAQAEPRPATDMELNTQYVRA